MTDIKIQQSDSEEAMCVGIKKGADSAGKVIHMTARMSALYNMGALKTVP